MRYTNQQDAQLLRRRALSPVLLLDRRRQALPNPGRGLQGLEFRAGARMSLCGFGATGSPVGQGAASGAATGASEGAAVGSIIPGIGTAIGAVVGAVIGAVAGSFGKKDPEVDTLGAALTGWRNSGHNPNWLYQLANKYLVLAGLMDLTPSQIAPSSFPVYLKYGRMGEINFARDLVQLLSAAGLNGQITATMTPGDVWNNIVLPWMDSWGKGRNVDRGGNGNFVDALEQGLMMDYLYGTWTSWASRTGSRAEMQNWPNFQLATPARPVTASPTPSPQVMTPIASAPSGALPIPPVMTFITQAPDSVTGAATGLPSGAIYAGKTATGAWIIQYASGANAGSYTLQNGQLTPYAPSAPAGGIATATNAAVVTGGGYTSLAPTAAPGQPVSTTPPALGAAITTLRDNSTGQMVAIPPGGIYAGQTSTGGGLVTYPVGGPNPAGTYDSNNAILTLYGAASSGSGSVGAQPPAGYSPTGQSILLNGASYPLYADPTGSQYVWTGAAMVPYSSGQTSAVSASTTSGGGGGGGYSPGYAAPQGLPGGTPQGDLAQNAAALSSPGFVLDDKTLLLLGAGALAFIMLQRKRA